jgi:tetratricopeptide (TPR) repeat protein
MKCDRCSLESDVEQAFSTEKDFFVITKYYCPDCTIKRQTRSFILSIVTIAVCGFVLYWLNPYATLGRILMLASLSFVAAMPLVVVHELAHAIVARMLGLRVFGIVIGIGRTVWSGKFLGMEWYLNVLPIAGITSVGARPVHHLRVKLFFIYLAGPLSHIVMAGVLYFLGQLAPLMDLWRHFLNLLVIINIILAVGNLYPRKTTGLTGVQGTDGWHLFRVLSLSDAEMTKRNVGYYVAEAMQSFSQNEFDAAKKWLDQGLALDANSGLARNMLGLIQLSNGEYRASRETFIKLLEAEEAKEPGFRFILLNNIAYLNALIGDPSLLTEADQYSAEAFKHLPWVSSIVGTRGSVLVELGQFEEGIPLLKKSMALHGDKQGKALNACHIAIGEYRRGNLTEARKYLSTAKTLDPRSMLIPQAEEEMAKPLPLISNSNSSTQAVVTPSA